MATLRGLLLIVAFDLLGEAAARHAHVPLPGPVVGMVLLLLALGVHAPLAEAIDEGGRVLLRNMSLLFVPAGVGVLTSVELVRAEGVWMLLVVVVSTLLALVAGAGAFVIASRGGRA